MNSAGYTYVNVDTGKEKIWAAAPETPVKKGDTVTIPPGMLMRNHHSKTLNRTFDAVYFVSSISVAGMAPAQEKPDSDSMDMIHGRNIAAAPCRPIRSFAGSAGASRAYAPAYARRDAGAL